ncbi:MAG TPA: methyltransferase domain-containing protein, partial [Candidatus Hodarchaeales archaeon]|nr:methyltransferase domain-containing protein [Candidatus Hodarchaeales archaeon]
MKYLLNLGCGSRFHPDFVNIDFVSSSPCVLAHNVTTGIPFSDNSFDVVYHSHLLEHLHKEQALKFLRECAR